MRMVVIFLGTIGSRITYISPRLAPSCCGFAPTQICLGWVPTYRHHAALPWSWTRATPEGSLCEWLCSM